jgi:hypothetical protein
MSTPKGCVLLVINGSQGQNFARNVKDCGLRRVGCVLPVTVSKIPGSVRNAETSNHTPVMGYARHAISGNIAKKDCLMFNKSAHTKAIS